MQLDALDTLVRSRRTSMLVDPSRPVPHELVVVIGTPPPGYRYVRVLNDILLIAIGSRIVIDAIEDLMR